MLAAITGPSHPKMAGTASPDVLCDCVGPKTITDWDRSEATVWRPTRPKASRPGIMASAPPCLGTRRG
jgi:hypothetical protein